MNFDVEMAQMAQYASNYVTPPPGIIQRSNIRPVTPQCILVEANRQKLEVHKLLSVMKVENGRVGQFTRNSNGTYDVGPMQINTVNLPDIAKKLGTTKENVLKYLAYDGCFNVSIGAWILRSRTDEVNGDFWMGIGRYHSKSPTNRDRYIMRVHTTMTNMVAKAQARTKPEGYAVAALNYAY
jgi:soluble lytic murein transglycosylase-like protein